MTTTIWLCPCGQQFNGANKAVLGQNGDCYCSRNSDAWIAQN